MRFICKMKIVGQGRKVNTQIPFRVWRKFAAYYRVPYESWEEGQVVLLEELNNQLLSNLR